MSLPSNSAVDPAEPARVIIVEDEPLVAENLRDDLVEAGFEVVGVAPPGRKCAQADRRYGI